MGDRNFDHATHTHRPDMTRDQLADCSGGRSQVARAETSNEKIYMRSIEKHFFGNDADKNHRCFVCFWHLWAWGLVPRKDAKMGAPVQPARRGWFQCCMGVPRSSILRNLSI